eukprot:2686463-Rhodomonas_salina.1
MGGAMLGQCSPSLGRRRTWTRKEPWKRRGTFCDAIMASDHAWRHPGCPSVRVDVSVPRGWAGCALGRAAPRP